MFTIGKVRFLSPYHFKLHFRENCHGNNGTIQFCTAILRDNKCKYKERQMLYTVACCFRCDYIIVPVVMAHIRIEAVLGIVRQCIREPLKSSGNNAMNGGSLYVYEQRRYNSVLEKYTFLYKLCTLYSKRISRLFPYCKTITGRSFSCKRNPSTSIVTFICVCFLILTLTSRI